MADKHNQDSNSDSVHLTVQTILVVEDDEGIGDFIVQAIIQETPYQALHVTSGKQALEKVKSLKPNLFLLDYMLPDMNGIELYDQLHALDRFEHVPALLWSARPPFKEARKRKLTCLSKPVELDELLQCIQELLA
ncbi:MAG: hypothetical protein NVS4B7_05980 [Ktedonobacteraceae bacterium]